MGNFEIPQDVEFIETIRKFETSDPAHASLFNAVNEKLFLNEIFLKLLTESHANNKENAHGVTKNQIGLGNADNTADKDKPVSTLVRAAIDQIYASGNGYTDKKISDLINGAPTTLDTLKELADAIASNKTIVDALNQAIGRKANQTELDTHTGNYTLHITASERNSWNAKQNAISIDGELSTTSVNPVQNRVITTSINSQNTNIANGIASVNASLGGVKLIAEGSGGDTKYYAQLGADAASKKPLGSGYLVTLRLTRRGNTTSSANIAMSLSNLNIPNGNYMVFVDSDTKIYNSSGVLQETQKKISSIASCSNNVVTIRTSGFEWPNGNVGASAEINIILIATVTHTIHVAGDLTTSSNGNWVDNITYRKP